MKTILSFCVLAAVVSPLRASTTPAPSPQDTPVDPVALCSPKSPDTNLGDIVKGIDPAVLMKYFKSAKSTLGSSAVCDAFIATAKYCESQKKCIPPLASENCWANEANHPTNSSKALVCTQSSLAFGKFKKKLNVLDSNCSGNTLTDKPDAACAPSPAPSSDQSESVTSTSSSTPTQFTPKTPSVVADVPANGSPTPTSTKPDDPNKWNDNIAGAKAALWLGIVGFILGGPAGMMVCAMMGFGAGYLINKISSGD
jgi:hypothetical protein